MKLLALILATAALAGPCAAQPAATPAPSATIQGDPSRPAEARWIRAELYFGVGPVEQPGDVAEIRWQAFLDREVTPRFPDGLTVLDAYGQWKGHGSSQIERLRSKVLVILCEDSAESRAKIDAIRVAYKKLTGDKSVLLDTTPADVSF